MAASDRAHRDHSPEHEPAPGHQEQGVLESQLNPAKPAHLPEIPPPRRSLLRLPGDEGCQSVWKKPWDTQRMLVMPSQFRKTFPLALQHLTPACLTLQRTLTLLFNI